MGKSFQTSVFSTRLARDERVTVCKSLREQKETKIMPEPAIALRRQPMAFEPALTSEEAARLLNIHPKTLLRMARKGQVPGHRIGDLWRFRASELDAWFRGERARLETPLVP